MAKVKEPNLVVSNEGLAHDPNTEIKAPSLSDLGIDGAFIKETVRPLIKDIVVQGVRDQLGLKKSELNHKSKAFKVSIFFKEIGWSLIMMGAAVMALSIGFRLLIRWVGL